MWRRNRKKTERYQFTYDGEFGLTDALRLLHSGIATSVSAEIEYRGKTFPVRIGEQDKPPPPSVATRPLDEDPMSLSARLEEKLLGKRDDPARIRSEQAPWLTLPEGYSFKVVFPFAGAAARFRVCKTANPTRDVSVYLDTKDVLGCVGEPYWEAYPINGDTERFLMAEGEQLIAAVVAELERGEE